MAVFKYRWNRILSLLFLIFLGIIVLTMFWNPVGSSPRRVKRNGPMKVIVIHSDRNIGRNKSQEGEEEKMMDLLRDQKCTIPKLDINGSEVIEFFHDSAPLKCQIPGNFEKEWVYLTDEGVIRFSEERQKAICQMKYFWRVNDQENEYGDDIYIKDGDKFDGGEYAQVNCYHGWSTWSTLLWNITPNQKALERARKMKKMKENPEKKAYNVYFLGFDSLSQMSFRRKLPQTVKFLAETMGSVVLNGYNIVGDGTPQAFIPILTSKTETELPLTRKRFDEAKYLDEVYPMIWKNYSDNGYVTMFGEDMHEYATFTYRLKGFKEQPVDHYPRTFFKDVEYRGDSTCINSQPIHKIWFQKCKQFMKVYQDVPKFLLMHQGLLSHDDINLVGVEDEDVATHLNSMNSEGIFDDSFVIVMADHGHRFAKLRETHQGQLEERMPFFSISIPKQLKLSEKGKKMERNLRENKDKLTTPFDIHSTLIDILNLSSTSSDSDSESTTSSFDKMQDASQQRSLSLFRPIPTDRTCAQAGIEAHWCTCLSWTDAMQTKEDRKLTRRIASAVVTEINKEISVEGHLCSPLTLFKIHESKKLLPSKDVLSYKNVKDVDGFVADLSGNTQAAFAHYQLKIETIPGNAIYEITLFYDIIYDIIRIDFGSISHVNKYGDNPHCIIDRNFFLATFCVCFDRV